MCDVVVLGGYSLTNLHAVDARLLAELQNHLRPPTLIPAPGEPFTPAAAAKEVGRRVHAVLWRQAQHRR